MYVCRKTRRFEVHPIYKNRGTKGEFNLLYEELRADKERFVLHFRMASLTYNYLGISGNVTKVRIARHVCNKTKDHF